MVKEGAVQILDYQHSSMLVSFAKANTLVYIPEKSGTFSEGDLVETLLLPNTILT
ncbi:MAG: hypothetical protein ACPG7A_07655 [Flavobacteriaceae bacterium]